MTKIEEEWRRVASLQGLYEVSNLGRVRRTKNRTVKSLIVTRDGYMVARVSVAGRKTDRFVHRLVAEAFIGKPTKRRPFINHRDGNKQHNAVPNLEYVTHQENMLHAFQHGLMHSSAKLTFDQVREVRALKGVMSSTQVATRYNMSFSCVCKIWRGETYGWLI